MAQGSLNEMDTQFEIALKLGYVESKDFENLELKMDRIGKMITGLIKNLKYRESWMVSGLTTNDLRNITWR